MTWDSRETETITAGHKGPKEGLKMPTMQRHCGDFESLFWFFVNITCVCGCMLFDHTFKNLVQKTFSLKKDLFQN